MGGWWGLWYVEREGGGINNILTMGICICSKFTYIFVFIKRSGGRLPVKNMTIQNTVTYAMVCDYAAQLSIKLHKTMYVTYINNSLKCSDTNNAPDAIVATYKNGKLVN